MTNALENQSHDNLEIHLAQEQTVLAKMRLMEERLDSGNAAAGRPAARAGAR
ncbi:MAG: hypothetical protein M0Z73_14270 [Betaproteobacteria bacterium]|nr:hypothetical protein [Betaproteobacteria bacterium]